MRSNSRPILTLAILVIAVIIAILGVTRGGAGADGPVSVVARPIQQAAESVARFISGATQGQTAADLRAQNTELQTQASSLAAEVIRLREFQAEVAQYRALLNFSRDNPAYSIIGADVIGIGDKRCAGANRAPNEMGVCANAIASDPSPYARYITINAGEQDGLKPGMAVVGGGLGLIGRVGQVNRATAQVQLLIDTASSINVTTIVSKTTGTLSGRADGSLVIQNVPQTDFLQAGDQVVTSGLGGNLPRLLPVGVIDQIISTDAQMFKEALVRPVIDFNRIDQVLVITSAP